MQHYGSCDIISVLSLCNIVALQKL